MYLRYNTKTQYTVVGKLLIKDNKSGPDMASSGAFSDLEMFNSAKNIDNEILILSSKTLMERVVTNLSLFTNYYIDGKFQDEEIYGEELPVKIVINQLHPEAYGKEVTIHIKDNNTFEIREYNGKATTHHFGQQIKKPYATFTALTAYNTTSIDTTGIRDIKVKFQDIQEVAIHYHNALKIVQVNENASVLNLTLTDPKPERAQDIINKLVEVYNKEASEDKNAIATNTLNFLDERLNYLTTEISGVEKNVEKYKSQNEVTDVSIQATGYLEQANNYNKQLADWAIQIDILRSIESYLAKNKGQYRMVPSSLGIQDPTLMTLIGKFNELQLERERMLRTTNPNSPLIQNINEQLANLRKNILENLRNIKASLIITSNKLKAASGQYKTKIKKVPSMERELLEISRQQSIKQNLYLYLLQKREETALSLAASVSHSRIIDPAMIEESAQLPNHSTIYLIAVLLGLGIPFSIIYVSNLFNNRVQTKQEVENLTDTPVLGEICHNTSQDTIVVSKGNRDAIVEMFRLIRTNLSFAMAGRTNKVIMVTSSMSGEGKTFFTINLGMSLVLTGKKVILLGLDLRKPELAKVLNLHGKPGITNYLISDDVTMDDLIHPVEKAPDLFAIGAGPIPPNPTELMMSAKLNHLITELKEIFDYIIIDTAPIGMVADAYTLSNLVDSSIYMVRYNHTLRSQVDIIENIYQNKTLPHPLLVLNDAKASGHYGYEYGYGAYGDDKKEKRKRKEKDAV
ncbi:GumC family protein [Sabulibacter ruber]|uniref:GumC family protein n=1 Tax=Sabulibacter ruber TaxID=2811901 RepID=UPI001F60FD2F|nr:tyrosine-protein kinase [Sabulibacter ruber]